MKPNLLTTIAIVLIATTASAKDSYINGSSKYGCIHKGDFDKTTEYVAQNDADAFTKFLGLGIATGVCVMFKPNEPIIVTDSGLFTSKVRRRGDVTEYWVDSSAIAR